MKCAHLVRFLLGIAVCVPDRSINGHPHLERRSHAAGGASGLQGVCSKREVPLIAGGVVSSLICNVKVFHS